jgi:hypothetical protein
VNIKIWDIEYVFLFKKILLVEIYYTRIN